MFLHGWSDHQEQFFCLFELKKPPWPYEWSLGQKRFFLWVLSSVFSRGQEMFCGCSRFRFGVCLSLTLETSASETLLRWPIHFINPVDKTKLSCNTPTDAAPQFLKKLPP